jgi:quinol monooxygenase YgiN
MAEKKITVMARIKARAGMEEKVKQELLSMVSLTRKEAGCINYDLHQSPDNKAVFLFYENWRSQKDLDDHLQMPYFKAFMGKGKDLLAEPGEITFWEMIS